MTFGNVDLHLIKGRPAVHSDDDLIVSHIAITVSDMDTIREKLKSLGCPYRTNISVPNPADTGKSFSEALILASTNPQYDKRLFIVQYMKIASSVHVVHTNCFVFVLTFRTIYVHIMF